MTNETWIVGALHGEMATKRALYEYWRDHAVAAEKDGRTEDARILTNAAQRNLDDCVRIQLQINFLSMNRDGAGHELDAPETPANTARLEAEARRNDDDDQRPQRQPRGL